MKSGNANEAILQELRRRMGDYESVDVVGERNKLIAMWRAAHPEAAAQDPSQHRYLDQIEPGVPGSKDHPEIWVNDIYHVTVRRWPQGDRAFGTKGPMIQIGINSHDGTARHDWRAFQAIKNQIAGPECEAIELYPAESRLLDPSNYFSLWGFPALRRIKVGVEEGRHVFDADEAWAPQRAFAKEP